MKCDTGTPNLTTRRFIKVRLVYTLLGFWGLFLFQTVQEATLANSNHISPALKSAGGFIQNNCPSTPIVNQQKVDGALTTGDCVIKDERERFADFYSFEVSAGQQINLFLKPTFGPSLFLMDGNGVTIRKQEPFSSSARDVRLVFRAQRNDKMVVRVTSTTNRTTGPYSLTLSLSNCDAPPINPDVVVNGSITDTDCVFKTGGFGASDEAIFADFYSFTGVLGQQVVISHTATYRPELVLLDANGVQLASAANSFSHPNDCRLVFTPLQTGKYLIGVLPDQRETTGNYTLNYAIPTCQPIPVSSGQPIVGALAPTDCILEGSIPRYTDRFAVSGIVGQELTVTLTATDFSPRLVIKNQNGVTVATKEFNPARIAYTPLQTEPLTVEVTSVFQNDTGSYGLTVSNGVDYSISLSPSQLILPAKGTGSVTILVSRLGGFTGNVVVTPPTTGTSKIQLSPTSPQVVTGDRVSFTFKTKKASPGMYPLVFQAVDATGRQRSATLSLSVR
ncbi:MAG: PPC domain-containing protein [Blastocatellia bacterium]|nr:PPC domain-containing protein [Blastocatellia bacterium]